MQLHKKGHTNNTRSANLSIKVYLNHTTYLLNKIGLKCVAIKKSTLNNRHVVWLHE